MSRHLNRVHDSEHPWIRWLIILGLCLYFGAMGGLAFGQWLFREWP